MGAENSYGRRSVGRTLSIPEALPRPCLTFGSEHFGSQYRVGRLHLASPARACHYLGVPRGDDQEESIKEHSTPLLGHDHVLRLQKAVVGARLAANRDALLCGIPPAVIAGLPIAPDLSAQILRDLDALNAIGRLADGSTPLIVWLQNAVTLLDGRVEAREFRSVLQSAESTSQPIPGAPKASQADPAGNRPPDVAGQDGYPGAYQSPRRSSSVPTKPAEPSADQVIPKPTEPRPFWHLIISETGAVVAFFTASYLTEMYVYRKAYSLGHGLSLYFSVALNIMLFRFVITLGYAFWSLSFLRRLGVGDAWWEMVRWWAGICVFGGAAMALMHHAGFKDDRLGLYSAGIGGLVVLALVVVGRVLKRRTHYRDRAQ